MNVFQLIVIALPWLVSLLILDWVGNRSDSLLVIFLAFILVPASMVISVALKVYFTYKNKLKKPKLSTKIYNEYTWWDPRRYF